MLKLSLLTVLLLPIYARAQQADAAMKKFADDNARTLDVYNCNTALIRLAGQAQTPAQWDGVIARASECLKIDTSAVALEIRASAWGKQGRTEKALADYTAALAAAKSDLAKARQLNEDMGGAWEDKVKDDQQFIAALYVDRSDVYVLLGKRDLAEADLKSALATVPGDYKASSNLKDLDKNIREKAEEMRAARPVTLQDHLFAGGYQFRKMKYPEALALYDKALAMDPASAEAYKGRADVKRVLPDLTGAIADYEKAISLDNKYADAYAGLGYAYRDKESWPLAVVEFTVALDKGRKTADLLAARGYANLRNRQFAAALKDYAAAEKIIPADDNYALIGIAAGMGDAYRETGRTEEAMAAYAKSIQAGKKDFMGAIFAADAYIGRGRLYAAQGNRTAAEADFKAALAAVPGHKEATAELARLSGATAGGKTAEDWSNQGRKEYAERKYADAVASFTKSIELAPKTAFYYSLRGFAHAANGNNAGFEGDFETAIRLSPNDKSVYFLRATVLETKGRKAEAVDDYRRVIKLDPAHEGAKKRLEALGG